ncbi:tRNA1(Val) (adenine(37)-N6)-methyltransferase [Longitalea arenae]|uniref:tRNA1(Val) (adenine(37)-N6)-methyltransferase n=1 Tax=Longitalea arenae TaxID=2812558 RepID=UPI00196826A6|nr:methyltransferase [Longitalea arenae]
MANSYFQFKQFTIHQDQCALKVCTDACIFGAWFSAKIPQYATVLDIGAGTGLLMMMLAQRSQAEIHGIEIDLAAYRQAKENISQNAWATRMKVFPGDARSFRFPLQYDFIITNPPFFEDDLPSTDDRAQTAKHSKHLTLEELIDVISGNLQPHGAFGILLPYHRWEYFHTLATRYSFSLTEKLFVKQSPRHNHFRAILHYTRHHEDFSPTFELTIQEPDRSYTPEFMELMKDYYLYL